MPDSALVTVVYPAYNERKRILSTIGEAVHFFESNNLSFQIIVSADGTDGTGNTVREIYSQDPRVLVLESTERRGKGFGIRRGVEKAIGKYVGYVDADNKTPIGEFARFLPFLESGADVVIGNRWTSKKSDPNRKLYRTLGSIAFVKLMQTVVGLKEIQDTQCGFKFFSQTAAKQLFQMQNVPGYMFDVELLLNAKKLGYRIAQVPVPFKDDDDTRLNLFTGNLANIRDVLKIRLRNLA